MEKEAEMKKRGKKRGRGRQRSQISRIFMVQKDRINKTYKFSHAFNFK